MHTCVIVQNVKGKIKLTHCICTTNTETVVIQNCAVICHQNLHSCSSYVAIWHMYV